MIGFSLSQTQKSPHLFQDAGFLFIVSQFRYRLAVAMILITIKNHDVDDDHDRQGGDHHCPGDGYRQQDDLMVAYD